eukprot:GHVU01147816.1.p1 GENE.GHVU01147816.1~~GHVU01147816.1.p1  ORF type:complete len:158 (+),score=11.31 GHVU01147816.1:591-1064(+)
MYRHSAIVMRTQCPVHSLTRRISLPKDKISMLGTGNDVSLRGGHYYLCFLGWPASVNASMREIISCRFFFLVDAYMHLSQAHFHLQFRALSLDSPDDAEIEQAEVLKKQKEDMLTELGKQPTPVRLHTNETRGGDAAQEQDIRGVWQLPVYALRMHD